MKHIAWIHKQTKAVHSISTYGDVVSYTESDTSYPVEIDVSNKPTVGMLYDMSTNTFISAPPKRETRKRGDK